MANIEMNLSNYQVPEDTAKQFENISNFAKNMILKDSKYYDSIKEGCETELSAAFGKLLIKYYEEELDDNDLKTLFNIINNYNNMISNALEIKYKGQEKNKNYYLFGDEKEYNNFELFNNGSSYNNNFNNANNDSDNRKFNNHFIAIKRNNVLENKNSNRDFLLKVLGLYKSEDFSELNKQDFSQSIISYIANSIFYDSLNENGVIEYKVGEKTYTITYKDNFDHICAAIFLMIFRNGTDSIIGYLHQDNITNNIKTRIDSSNNEYYTNLLKFVDITNLPLNAKSLIKDKQSIENITSDGILSIEDAVLSFIKNSYFNSDERKNNLRNLIITLFEKEFINYYLKEDFGKAIYDNKSLEKRSAAEIERQYINSSMQTPIIELKLSAATASKVGFNVSRENELNIIKKEKEPLYPIQILYKELNSAYRQLYQSDFIETSVLYKKKFSSADLLPVYDFWSTLVSTESSYTTISYDTASYIQFVGKIPFLIRDFNNDTLKSYKTTRLHQYQMGNPYIGRKACESDVINYYIGDSYISNSYGYYKYEKEEISLFLTIFKQTRDYFYKVLLNESFINEKDYSSYEKIFLIFWSIERFLSYKIESNKDIDKFDQTDIKNFLESYGMGNLADAAVDNSYYLEDIVKNVLKHYIPLNQNKGSRKIFPILEESFTISDGALDIYKTILARDTTRDVNDTKRYRFLKANFNNPNTFAELMNNISFSTPFSSMIANDYYWTQENTPLELLDELNVNVANTKYIIPEFTVDIGENYIITRCTFALIEYFFKQILDEYYYPLFYIKFYDENKDGNIDKIKAIYKNKEELISENISITPSINPDLSIKIEYDSNTLNFTILNDPEDADNKEIIIDLIRTDANSNEYKYRASIGSDINNIFNINGIRFIKLETDNIGENNIYDSFRIALANFPLIDPSTYGGASITLKEAINVIKKLYKDFIKMHFEKANNDSNNNYDDIMKFYWNKNDENNYLNFTNYFVDVPVEKLARYINFKEINDVLYEKETRGQVSDGQINSLETNNFINKDNIMNDFADADLHMPAPGDETQIEYMKTIISSIVPMYIVGCSNKRIETSDNNSALISPTTVLSVLNNLYINKNSTEENGNNGNTNTATSYRDAFNTYLYNSLMIPSDFINFNWYSHELDCKSYNFISEIFNMTFLNYTENEFTESLDNENNITYSKFKGLKNAIEKKGNNGYDFLYISDEDENNVPDILPEYSQTIDGIMDGIIMACNILTEILETSINSARLLITLGPSDKALLTFLQLTIEYFISFTNQVHNLVYKNRYAIEGESLNPTDGMRCLIKNTQIDSFYTDEKLIAKVIDIG